MSLLDRKSLYDKNRKELGKVVAPVGTNPQKKFLVIQKDNDKPTVLDPEAFPAAETVKVPVEVNV